ncbi:voltage-dependent calcium channel subunit alpha-2/delta-3 isoform X2 [Leguminivora glycinivorella]|uniref:voltage-dependent calcium channel subunit alpha-2/delta-3 isoform X2 n=1 Tax=Leguminivora glycinivorella TaxID=1035111 RepID=UPI00201064C1|nr:voltage-dependent calcium channel subunit alpha-2/delta-3 isoform X2 [Leguminivora glycinivorella]
MALRGSMSPLALFMPLLAVAALANQLEDIPHNEVKNWALKFGVDLWEFGRHFTKMNQIQNKYHEYNVEVARKDGLLLVRELAAEVKNHMDFKINAVMRIMDSAEAAALSSGGSDGPGAYYDARWLNVHADDGTLAARARRLVLAPSRHFDHIAVNASYSAVLMPPYINVENGDVQNQIAWSEHLDPLFVNNYEIDPSLSWQYYASSTGFMRRYPAMSWPPEDGYSHHARDFYDFRSSNWFVEAATSPKDLVILLDDSDDLGSSYWRLAKATVSGLLDTLGPNDFVNVYRYSDTVSEIHSCYTKILAQAVPETIRELKTALWAAEATGGAANLTGALTSGFEILHRYNRTGQGCQCNQAIAVVGAGGGAAGVKGVFRTWNWPHMPVRIFSYGVGGDAASGHNMKDMACTNKGFYVSINEHSEIRPKVLHMIEVLARPLVMYQTMHPVHWSPVYVGGRSSNLDDDGMGQLMTSVTVPIFDRRNHTHREANLLGVVGTDVPVDQIKKLVPPYKLGVNGYSFMVDNNGHVLYHPDLRPLYTNEEYTETLRPLYSSVDLTDVELLVDADENSRVNLTSLLLDLRHDMIEQREGETEIGVKVQYGSMRRVATRRQRYFYSPVEGTPYSLAIVLPDGYGMYELQAEQEVKHSPINVTEYFKGDNWKIHPEWVYCEYASTSDQTFNTAEEQLLHFLARAGRPGWKWMSLRPRALTLHNMHKKQDRDSYYCDKNLVQSLVRDAMVIKELDAHTGHASHHNHPIATLMALLTRQGRFHKFVVSMSFIATRSGLFRWTDNNNSTRTGDTSEPHFSERYARAFDSEWYRRAVEHHNIEPESFVFSVPFRDAAESAATPLVLATHAVFVESRGHRAPAAVVGLQFHLDSLAKHFLNVTSTCTAGTTCKKTCAGDALDCYILDDNGFIILSEDAAQTGLFFGQVDGTIMDSLVQDRIYKKVTVHDRQGRCPDSRNPFSGDGNKLTPFKPLSWLGGYLTSLLAVWFPLWQSAKAHAHPYADDDIDYEDYEHDGDEDPDEEERDRGKYEIIIDGYGAEKPVERPPGAGAPREPPREAARSAAVRPCDTSAELFTLQSTRLNAAQPLKGKLTNCHNSGCERPFSVQKIPHSNLILLVVDTLCPCGAKRLDVRAREAPPRTVCRRHPAHATRRRPRHCVSYHPEEIEILSCGRGSSTRAPWALLLATVTALRWLARAT